MSLKTVRLRSSCAVLFVLAATAFPSMQPACAAKGLPPLIDRELLFGDPEISGAQISPDGQFISFLKPFEGVRNIWVKRTAEPFERARPVTADTARPISSYFWSLDAKYLLYSQDRGGDENYNVYAVAPYDPPAAGKKVPPSRNLTDVRNVQAQIYTLPKAEPDVVYVGLNDRDQAWHDLYRVRISNGERTLVRRNDERITSWTFDLTGRLRLATRSAENGDTEVLRVDKDRFTRIYNCTVFESCDPVQFHNDGRRLYLATNKGADANLTRLVLLDLSSAREELVEVDPKNRVDLGGTIFSRKTDELVATAYRDDKMRVVPRERQFAADYELLQRQLSGKDVEITATLDERLWLVFAEADVDPGEAWLFDRGTKQLTLQYRLRERLPRERLAAMTPIRYPSSDGLEIPAYLTLPKGVEPKNLPLVIQPHGGPWSRDNWGYDPLVQFLANRGFAVLQPNFRGSTGYGKKVIDAGNGQWGEKMQDDLTWGAKYLVSRGIADSRRIAILGVSYGGYAALAGIAFTPEVYAAAVSIVGPSSLITLMNSIPPYWESIRELFHKRMGDPTTTEGRARLERQSPLNSVAEIRTPLLVIQGANDPRVKKAESDQIVAALCARGFPVGYVVAPDEGHSFARPVNTMAAFAAAEKFLAQHVGTRYQESMTTEVAERLKQLTVDPRSLALPKMSGAAKTGCGDG